MRKFIGTKQVSAEPMTLGEFIERIGRDPYANDPMIHGSNEEGYIVEYEDGYKAWSPKNVFEKAYKVSETYVDRMRIEFDELRERMKKLKDFLYSEKSFELDKSDVYDLECQYRNMDNYAQILLRRIRRAVKPECGEEMPECGEEMPCNDSSM